jgi:amino acid adenylation domain-containing protein/thioester reductase-like protein
LINSTNYPVICTATAAINATTPAIKGVSIAFLSGRNQFDESLCRSREHPGLSGRKGIMTTAYYPEKAMLKAVVVNALGQHALWPADLDVPAGWQRRSEAMPEPACLDRIARDWLDIAPASVRVPAREQPVRGRHTRFVHQMWSEQANRRPDATAVIAGRKRLTYRQLDQSSNRLAHHLRAMGAAQETLVGVCLERGVDAIRSLLAIMKTGSGYLPLDPSLPLSRLEEMLAEACPVVVLAQDASQKLAAATRSVLHTGELDAVLGRQPAEAPDVSPHPDDICYAVYTSGSAGRPKAVAISHGSLACTIGELRQEYQMSAQDRVLQLASLAFDTSLEQVLVTLASGSTLMLPPAGTLAPTDLLRYLARQRITVIDLTPAYWHQVTALTQPDDERLRTLRLMITGGDIADPADCQAAMRAAPRARMLNAYGLTETTITSALYDIGTGLQAPRPGTPAPVGKPLRHTRILVLDSAFKPVSRGTAGEIYVGGCGVARGYLGRPALTAELFLPDCRGDPGSRMYRTGDLGRWREDGNLEVIGRADRQLKVRGFRVEPGEVENVLTGYPGIGQTAVVATTHGSGDTRLVAYYTLRNSGTRSRDPATGPSATSLRRYLRTRLPGYMVPTSFVALDRMPVAAGGEPARDALQHHATPPGNDQSYPRTPTEAGLCHLWAKILAKEQVHLDDDFFELGGNSLLAAEMLAHTRVMFGIGADQVRPLTRCLLRDPSLRRFAKAVQEARAGRLTADSEAAPIDFAREAELGVPVRLDAEARPNWNRPLEVLLTGSTGFLGAHLLRELLAATTARVWCLVRARDASDGFRRIAGAAARYNLGTPSDLRVVPLPGDLASPRLGLSADEFRELARSIDIIYHVGAVVNFIYPYEELHAANVAGTRELIQLAGLYRGIPVHYVSSTAVLAGLGVTGIREVTEYTPLDHANRLRMGYVATKFVAEELLRNAGRAGLSVAVYRPMDIIGGLPAGSWNTATEMCALIRYMTDTGVAPDIDLLLDFVPADICAAAIRHISSLDGTTGRTYHLASPGPAPLRFLVERLRVAGFQITEMPFDAWVSDLQRHAAHNPSHPMTPFLPLFVDRDRESGLTVAEMYLEHIFPRYTRTNTEQALRGSGIRFPAVDSRLLDLNIGGLISTGYLPDPGVT